MAELFNVLTPGDALFVLRAHLQPGSHVERVPIERALGRTLVEDLRSPEDLPAFPRSTMDGFAVRAADTYGASEGLPAYLLVRGEVLMGVAAAVRVDSGEAARIATGGMLPAGADAVVMVENTQTVDEATIEVVRPVAPGENVLQVGEDVSRGSSLFGRGQLLRPQDVGGLAALGLTEVEVAARLRVAIVSSGDELVPPDAEPAPGQIRDVNSYTLAALVEQAGHEPVLHGIVPDVYDELVTAARRGLDSADALILSAGSSVSIRDMTAQVIASLGEPGVLVHGVSLRPGKPTILAVADAKPVFGLPGNPVSCMITFDLFVAPALARLCGLESPPARPTVRARLVRNIPSAPGREDYMQVALEERDGALCAMPIFGKSNLIYTLVRADGLVKVDLDRGGLAEGEQVPVMLF